MNKKAKVKLEIMVDIEYLPELTSVETLMTELQYEVNISEEHADVATIIGSEFREWHITKEEEISPSI